MFRGTGIFSIFFLFNITGHCPMDRCTFLIQFIIILNSQQLNLMKP